MLAWLWGAPWAEAADQKKTPPKSTSSKPWGGTPPPNPAKGNALFESAYEIVLKNAKKEPVTVSVLEPIYGDWEVLQESHPHAKAAASAARFKVPVPAEGTATLTYRVKVKW